MLHRARPKKFLGQLLVLGGAVVFVTGSVLVFMVPPPSVLAKETPEPEPLVSVSVFPRPEAIPDYTPPKPTPTPKPTPAKVKPSATSKPKRIPAPVFVTPTPPKVSTKPVPAPSTSPKPLPKPSAPAVTRTPTPVTTVPTPQLTPKPTPKPTPSQTGSGSHTADLINAKRVAKGLKPLKVDPALTIQSQGWSEHMASTGDFTHSTYGVRGEIIGEGYTTAESVVAAWEASPPHNAIMYGPYTLIGVGAANPGGYWTVQFG